MRRRDGWRAARRGLMVLAALAAGAGALAAQQSQPAVRQRTLYEDLQMLSGVLNQIRVNHPDSVDQHAMILAAIEAMVHEADPHSFLIPSIRLSPEKQKAYDDGKSYPVPIDFGFIDGSPVVSEVAPGTAASRLDILPGDELIAIDSQPVQAQSPVELDVFLSGDKNSIARLTFERRRIDGSLTRLDREVKRERPGEAMAVPADFMLDVQTGYVRVTTFEGDKVADELHAALGNLEGRGMKRLVLDLRGNGGGRIDQAAKVAGEFLPKGTLVYTAEGRKADVTDTGRVSRSFWSHEKRYPIVLLVNSGTASASELVAGALQDHDRALIVGHRTFGKSLEMTQFLLPDGSLLEMVIGHLRTPCGRIIQRQYRGMTRSDYFRAAGEDRDTTGAPSCKTDGGRTVYGGGGIYPDVVLPRGKGAPLWMAEAYEDALTLQWVPGYVTANAASLASIDVFAAEPMAPEAAATDFRSFAASHKITIPADAAADSLLRRRLAVEIAYTKWGESGAYRVAATQDPEVAAAVATFDRAAAILASQP